MSCQISGHKNEKNKLILCCLCKVRNSSACFNSHLQEMYLSCCCVLKFSYQSLSSNLSNLSFWHSLTSDWLFQDRSSLPSLINMYSTMKRHDVCLRCFEVAHVFYFQYRLETNTHNSHFANKRTEAEILKWVR